MNLSKHVNVSYRTMKSLSKELQSNFYVRHEPISVEGSCDIFELVKRKKVIVDAIPIASAFFILSHAKLHVLKVRNILCYFVYNRKYSSSTI